ncbi:MAG: response regulator [Parcubacteria group bacterium]|jgi:DNA-binding response OmpR family regulator
MPKILIAEDDKMMDDMYRKKFSDSGFEVFIALNEKETFDIIEKEKIDVVLVSLLMNGFEIVKKIRKDGSNPNMKIIITGYHDIQEDEDMSIEVGADAFVNKSHTTPSELLAKTKKLMEKQ